MEKIYNAGFSVYTHGFSAIDSWLNSKRGNHIHILTNACIADLAKLFENLRYPGASLADAALDHKDITLYFKCEDSIYSHQPSFSLLKFYQEYKTRVFHDPCGIYPLLTGIRKGTNAPFELLQNGLNSKTERSRALIDASLILAKYFQTENEAEKQTEKIAYLFDDLDEEANVTPEEQRMLVCGLVTSNNPALGLGLLKTCGFIEEYWQELAALDKVEHNKEFHPEGNVWEHTMETFRHRKHNSCDLRLSLGLLLHDTGKPISVSDGSKRFYAHAELGATQARRFLERLGFGSSLISDVCFLVKNHMLAAALPRLPLFRTAEIMSSELFPILLELYRCDESSSFKGLEGYYDSSAAYQAFLRNRRNPYRTENGKKLNKKQVSTIYFQPWL